MFVYAIINGGGYTHESLKSSCFWGLFKKTLPKTVRLYTKNPIIGATAGIQQNLSAYKKRNSNDYKREEAKAIPIEATVTPFRCKDLIYKGLQKNGYIERGLHLLKKVNKLLTCSWPLYSLRNIVFRNI